MGFGWSPPPVVIGHRGSPRDAPENTLASFRAAQDAGADAIELDARLTRDGAVVVHHDPALGRIFPGDARIEDLTAAEATRMGIPLLADALALGMRVDVELKADADDASGLPRAALAAIRAADALDRCLVTSFDPSLADAYAAASGRPAGAIFPFVPEPEDLAAWPRLAYLCLAEDACEPEVVAAARAAGRVVLAWTVNDAASARRLLAMGVAGVITDRPATLRRAIAEGAPAG